MLKQQYELTADDLEEKDWRDMSDKEWEKLLNSFDQNIDAIKDKIRKLKEVQDEAASKAAANAPAGRRQMQLRAQRRVQQPMDLHRM